MLIIGLCGSSGSGKGYVCRLFAKHGVAFIDTDLVYRENVLTSKACVDELVKNFGNGILENGLVSKKHLAKIVFEGEGSSSRLKRLNEITHKYIKIETERLITRYEGEGYGVTIIDAPVLFESGFDNLCHVTVCVTASHEDKLTRIMERDGITKEKAQARLSAQLSDPELRKRCTYEIDNQNGKDVEGQIVSILRELGVL